ncbi:protein shoot gravitropism 5 [Phtheirospermum japonicum]|uniref:Protein shoot gravitropism 5 n=1 Tax=Phtheirospermum japonicum TaxID=374723 RepID=A0A830BCV9_9LAMI|nr:protein shoot gravitropism 5 [Phtheirospermum japonicum]
MLSNINNPSPSSDPFSCSENGSSSKRKRRPAGTPDPDAEVVSLSPKTLLESDRYVCEICNQGFQRDQNLQMHRRRHKVPWKLLKRDTPVARKRVFVCPEPSCLHHDPCHALGDLVGIKKHFRRKHSNQKQWVCEKCSKGYAVQSDYKAHLKTCGTRGHSCDCGRVFSRVESFIEHQDACSMGRLRSDCHPLQPPPSACLSRTASSPSPSSDTNLSVTAWAHSRALGPNKKLPMDHHPIFSSNWAGPPPPNLELELLTKASTSLNISPVKIGKDHSTTQLQLSIGSSETERCSPRGSSSTTTTGDEQLRVAMAERGYAEEARVQAKRQIELAEQEFSNAKKLRQQARAELEKAQALKEHATKQMDSTIMQITCHSCKLKFQHESVAEASSSLSYISAALREWDDVRKSY